MTPAGNDKPPAAVAALAKERSNMHKPAEFVRLGCAPLWRLFSARRRLIVALKSAHVVAAQPGPRLRCCEAGGEANSASRAMMVGISAVQ